MNLRPKVAVARSPRGHEQKWILLFDRMLIVNLAKKLFCIGELRLKFFDHLVPDRVTALMNARPDGCAKVLGLTAKYFAHAADSFLDNAFGRPAPSGMKGGNHALLRI